MDEVNTNLIEHYQLLFQKDPKSKIFATLGEAYRKLGMAKQAIEVCKHGLKHHPDFAGGRVALARALLDLDKWEEAKNQLERAVELSPENILAHTLLAETWLKLKEPKKALKSYKMVLFLRPDHEKAQKAVKKLESLTADEYDDDVFSMKPLSQAMNTDVALESPVPPAKNSNESSTLERHLSLADAFIVRNDIDRAIKTLREAERLLGPQPQINQRLQLIESRFEEKAHKKTAAPIENRKQLYQNEKIAYLKRLLKQIAARKDEHGRHK